jgi:hypothetical protein
MKFCEWRKFGDRKWLNWHTSAGNTRRHDAVHYSAALNFESQTGTVWLLQKYIVLPSFSFTSKSVNWNPPPSESSGMPKINVNKTDVTVNGTNLVSPLSIFVLGLDTKTYWQLQCEFDFDFWNCLHLGSEVPREQQCSWRRIRSRHVKT